MKSTAAAFRPSAAAAPAGSYAEDLLISFCRPLPQSYQPQQYQQQLSAGRALFASLTHGAPLEPASPPSRPTGAPLVTVKHSSAAEKMNQESYLNLLPATSMAREACIRGLASLEVVLATSIDAEIRKLAAQIIGAALAHSNSKSSDNDSKHEEVLLWLISRLVPPGPSLNATLQPVVAAARAQRPCAELAPDAVRLYVVVLSRVLRAGAVLPEQEEGEIEEEEVKKNVVVADANVMEETCRAYVDAVAALVPQIIVALKQMLQSSAADGKLVSVVATELVYVSVTWPAAFAPHFEEVSGLLLDIMVGAETAPGRSTANRGVSATRIGTSGSGSNSNNDGVGRGKSGGHSRHRQESFPTVPIEVCIFLRDLFPDMRDGKSTSDRGRALDLFSSLSSRLNELLLDVSTFLSFKPVSKLTDAALQASNNRLQGKLAFAGPSEETLHRWSRAPRIAMGMVATVSRFDDLAPPFCALVHGTLGKFLQTTAAMLNYVSELDAGWEFSSVAEIAPGSGAVTAPEPGKSAAFAKSRGKKAGAPVSSLLSQTVFEAGYAWALDLLVALASELVFVATITTQMLISTGSLSESSTSEASKLFAVVITALESLSLSCAAPRSQTTGVAYLALSGLICKTSATLVEKMSLGTNTAGVLALETYLQALSPARDTFLVLFSVLVEGTPYDSVWSFESDHQHTRDLFAWWSTHAIAELRFLAASHHSANRTLRTWEFLTAKMSTSTEHLVLVFVCRVAADALIHCERTFSDPLLSASIIRIFSDIYLRFGDILRQNDISHAVIVPLLQMTLAIAKSTRGTIEKGPAGRELVDDEVEIFKKVLANTPTLFSSSVCLDWIDVRFVNGIDLRFRAPFVCALLGRLSLSNDSITRRRTVQSLVRLYGSFPVIARRGVVQILTPLLSDFDFSVRQTTADLFGSILPPTNDTLQQPIVRFPVEFDEHRFSAGNFASLMAWLGSSPIEGRDGSDKLEPGSHLLSYFFTHPFSESANHGELGDRLIALAPVKGSSVVDHCHYAASQAALFSIVHKLRTPFGPAAATFESLYTGTRSLLDAAQRQRQIEQKALREGVVASIEQLSFVPTTLTVQTLIHFFFSLERAIMLVGQFSTPQIPRPLSESASFFETNRDVCAGLFERVRAPLAAVGQYGAGPDQLLHLAWAQLQVLQKRAAVIGDKLASDVVGDDAHSLISSLVGLVNDVEVAAVQAITSMCDLGDVATADGLRRWLKRMFVRPFSSYAIVVKSTSERPFVWTPFEHSFLWTAGAINFSRGEYERAAIAHLDALKRAFGDGEPFASRLRALEKKRLVVQAMPVPVPAVRCAVQQIADSYIACGMWPELESACSELFPGYRKRAGSSQTLRSALTPRTPLGYLRGSFQSAENYSDIGLRLIASLVKFDDGDYDAVTDMLASVPSADMSLTYASVAAAPMLAEWTLLRALACGQPPSEQMRASLKMSCRLLASPLLSAGSAEHNAKFSSLLALNVAMASVVGGHYPSVGSADLAIGDLLRFLRVAKATRRWMPQDDKSTELVIQAARHARHHRNNDLAVRLLAAHTDLQVGESRSIYELAKVRHTDSNISAAFNEATEALRRAVANPSESALSRRIALRLGHWLCAGMGSVPTASQMDLPPIVLGSKQGVEPATLFGVSDEDASKSSLSTAFHLLSFACTNRPAEAQWHKSRQVALMKLGQIYASLADGLHTVQDEESEMLASAWFAKSADITSLADVFEPETSDNFEGYAHDDALVFAERVYADVLSKWFKDGSLSKEFVSGWLSSERIRSLTMTLKVDVTNLFSGIARLADTIRSRSERCASEAIRCWGRVICEANNIPDDLALRLLHILLDWTSSTDVADRFIELMQADSNSALRAFVRVVPQILARLRNCSASSPADGAMMQLLSWLAMKRPHSLVFSSLFSDPDAEQGSQPISAVVDVLRASHPDILNSAEVLRAELLEISRLPAERWALAVANCEAEVRARTQRLIERRRSAFSGVEENYISQFVEEYVDEVVSPSIAPLVILQRETLRSSEVPHARWFSLTYATLTGSAVTALRETCAGPAALIEEIEVSPIEAQRPWQLASGSGRQTDGSIASPTDVAKMLQRTPVWAPLRELSREFTRFTRAPKELDLPSEGHFNSDHIGDEVPFGDQRSSWSLRAISSILASTKFEPGHLMLPGFLGSDLSAEYSINSDSSVRCLLDTVDVLPTKTHPRRIVMKSHSGVEHGYLLKAGEDLRLDERISQLFAYINTSLHDSSLHQRRKRNRSETPLPLFCATYAVVPLSPRVGLIQWVNGTVSLFDLYKSRVAVAIESRPTADDFLSLRPTEQFYAKLAPALQAAGIPGAPRTAAECAVKCANLAERRRWPMNIFRNVFRNLSTEAQRHGLTNFINTELWARSATAHCAMATQRDFASSLAVMSGVGYFIGLGDRHLDNILIAPRHNDGVSNAGALALPIDFNVCFEKGKRLRVPECVPFRLTQSLRSALGVLETDGVFRQALFATVSGLRVPRVRKHIRLLLDSFVTDPLRSWDPEVASVAAGVSENELRTTILSARNRAAALLDELARLESAPSNPLDAELTHLTQACDSAARITTVEIPQAIQRVVGALRRAKRACSKSEDDFVHLVFSSISTEYVTENPEPESVESPLWDELQKLRDDCLQDIHSLRSRCAERVAEQTQLMHDLSLTSNDSPTAAHAFGMCVSPTSLDDALRQLLDPRLRTNSAYDAGGTLRYLVFTSESDYEAARSISGPSLLQRVPALLFNSLETEMSRALDDVDSCVHSIVRALEASSDMLRDVGAVSVPFTAAQTWAEYLQQVLDTPELQVVTAINKELRSRDPSLSRNTDRKASNKQVSELGSTNSHRQTATALLESFCVAADEDVLSAVSDVDAFASSASSKFDSVIGTSRTSSLGLGYFLSQLASTIVPLIQELGHGFGNHVDRGESSSVDMAGLSGRCRVVARIAFALTDGRPAGSPGAAVTTSASAVLSVCEALNNLADNVVGWTQGAVQAGDPESSDLDEMWDIIWQPLFFSFKALPQQVRFDARTAVKVARGTVSSMVGLGDTLPDVDTLRPGDIEHLVARVTLAAVLAPLLSSSCTLLGVLMERLRSALSVYAELYPSRHPEGVSSEFTHELKAAMDSAQSFQQANVRLADSQLRMVLLRQLTSLSRSETTSSSVTDAELARSLIDVSSHLAALASDLRVYIGRLDDCNVQFISSEDNAVRERDRLLRAFTSGQSQYDRQRAETFTADTREFMQRVEHRRLWHANARNLLRIVRDVSDAASEALGGEGERLAGDAAPSLVPALEQQGEQALTDLIVALERLDAIQDVSRTRRTLREYFGRVRECREEASNLADKFSQPSEFGGIDLSMLSALVSAQTTDVAVASSSTFASVCEEFATEIPQLLRLCSYTDATASIYESARRVTSIRAKLDRTLFRDVHRNSTDSACVGVVGGLAATLISSARWCDEILLAAQDTQLLQQLATNRKPDAEGNKSLLISTIKQQQAEIHRMQTLASDAVAACRKAVVDASAFYENFDSALQTLTDACSNVVTEQTGVRRNAHGAFVVDRVIQKLRGFDSGSAQLTPEQQTDRMIRDATSETNLAQTYEGWTAWI